MQTCTTPGCPELVDRGHCTLHQKHTRRQQARTRRAAGDQSMDTYSTTAWRTTRRRFLKQNPTCIDCGTEATEADHTPPRRILQALAVPNPDDHAYLQPRCEPCHARKTRRIDTPLLRRLDNGEPPHQLVRHNDH